MILIMMGVGFLCQKKILAKFKRKTTFASMCFVTKTSQFFQSTIQIKNLKTRWIYSLQLMKTSHIMCISKILTDLCFTQQKLKNKNYFCKSCLQWFSSRQVFKKHKEDCLSINGTQSVKFEKGTIEFKNYFKKISVPFKIYADFECNSKSVEGHECSYSKKISKSHFLQFYLQDCLC